MIDKTLNSRKKIGKVVYYEHCLQVYICIYIYICISICIYKYLSMYLSIYLSFSLSLYIYIYIIYIIYICIYIYIHRHVFRPSQDLSVRLGSTSRKQLTSLECSKHQVLNFAKMPVVWWTNKKYSVLSSVLQSAQWIYSARIYPQTHVSSFQGLYGLYIYIYHYFKKIIIFLIMQLERSSLTSFWLAQLVF